MVAVLLLSLLLSGEKPSTTKQFRPISKAEAPRTLIQSELCDPHDTPAWCWERFIDLGGAWVGDVNDDGVDELLLKPGTGGTGGDNMILYQRSKGRWEPILYAFPYLERFDILPVVRAGYHDLHLDSLHCYKWGGKKYIRYTPEDYRKLRPEFFDTTNSENASILWLGRYAGLKSFLLEPHWFFLKSLALGGEKPCFDDRDSGIEWFCNYKGGIWGVRNTDVFLILPRCAHKGCEKLAFDGDWVLIFAEGYDKSPIARYNMRTHEMAIEKDDPYWLVPDLND